MKNFRINVSESRPESKKRTKNIELLENYWQDQIGLPVREQTKVDISSFNSAKNTKITHKRGFNPLLNLETTKNRT